MNASMDPTVKTYSLVFSFPDVIVGNGFTARVELNGTAVLEDGDGCVWIFGVQPGGVAGGGKDWAEARREFKERYLSVLFDIALAAPTFAEFKTEVEKFFHEVNEATNETWTHAVENVRKNGGQIAGCNTVRAEDHPPSLVISELDRRTMNPRINQFDAVELAQAAA